MAEVRHAALPFGPLSESDAAAWVRPRVGTVHTFQGKEAAAVIFCLGLDAAGFGPASWASAKPNLLNVAVTRAKYRLAVVGNKSLWAQQPYFNQLVGMGVREIAEA